MAVRLRTPILLSLFALFSLVHQQMTEECRRGWKKFDQSCYLFSQQEATWPEAEAICKSLHGYLTEINGQQENSFLKMIAQDYNSHGRKRASAKSQNSYWIGGDDIEVEGRFIWSLHNLEIVFSDWNQTQPDDTKTNEDCMELRQDFDYRWNDMFCTTRQKFICEMP